MVCVFNQFAQERPFQLGRQVRCHPMLELTRKKKKKKTNRKLKPTLGICSLMPE